MLSRAERSRSLSGKVRTAAGTAWPGRPFPLPPRRPATGHKESPLTLPKRPHLIRTPARPLARQSTELFNQHHLRPETIPLQFSQSGCFVTSPPPLLLRPPAAVKTIASQPSLRPSPLSPVQPTLFTRGLGTFGFTMLLMRQETVRITVSHGSTAADDLEGQIIFVFMQGR